jgi:hypothetical protein
MAIVLVNRLVIPTGTPDMLLDGGISDVATTLDVLAVPSNLGTTGDVRMLIYAPGDDNPEFIDMTSRSSLTLSIDRQVEESSSRPACVHADGAGIWIVQTAATAGGALPFLRNKLAADVTIGSGGTYVDGPSVSLAAGTWLLVGTVFGYDSGGSPYFAVKLWDGASDVQDSGENSLPTANNVCKIALVGIAQIVTTTTYKISAAVRTSGKIVAATFDPASQGNNASQLIAVKIG